MLSKKHCETLQGVLDRGNIEMTTDMIGSLATIVSQACQSVKNHTATNIDKTDIDNAESALNLLEYLNLCMMFHERPQLKSLLRNILRPSNKDGKPVMLFILGTSAYSKLFYLHNTLSLNYHSLNTLFVSHSDFYVKQMDKFQQFTNRYVSLDRFKPTCEIYKYKHIYMYNPLLTTFDDLKQILAYVDVKHTKSLTFTWDRTDYFLQQPQFESLSNLYEIKVIDIDNWERGFKQDKLELNA